MTKKVIILLLGLAAAIAFAALRPRFHRHRTAAPQWKTTEEMMQWLAAQAVDTAEKSYRLKLDYSTDSIERVEEILGKLHDEYVQSHASTGVRGLAMMFGAYIGECIRRSVPGSNWERDHPVGGERSYPLHWLGGESFPCGWSYKRIMNGPEDNVWHKYVLLEQERENGTGANPDEIRVSP